MLNRFSSFLIVFVFLISCTEKVPPAEDTPAGTVKITIMYPNGAGKVFNMDYYKENHMPMLAELFGEAMLKYEIDEGIGGRTPQDPIPYLAIGYLYFRSVEAYGKAFGPNAEQILGDIPNYTNIQPTVQISEVVK